MHEIVYVEGGAVVALSTWRKLEMGRAARLFARIESEYPGMPAVCEDGLLRTGDRVVTEDVTAEFPNVMHVDGRRVIGKRTRVNLRMARKCT